MTSALPKAKPGAESGMLEPFSGEKELKRCTKVLLDGDTCTVTLTNRRIIITSRTEKVPKELKLSDIVKSKLPSGGLFSKAKAANTPELTIKMTDDTKLKFTFTQYVFSIYSAVDERDDFLLLLTDNLTEKENTKNQWIGGGRIDYEGPLVSPCMLLINRKLGKLLWYYVDKKKKMSVIMNVLTIGVL